MTTLSTLTLNLANKLLKERKPEVLQEYAARVATALSKQGLADFFDLNAVHQYQGAGTNHCGPTTLAMIINILLGEEGYDCHQVNYNDLQAAMQAGSLGFGFTGYRISNTGLLHELHIADNVTGATLPWGLEQAFKDFNQGLMKSGGPDLGMASFTEGGTKENLIDNINKDYKTAIMVVWPENHGAHWMAVVGYHAEKDEFSVLDPANPKGGVTEMPWSFLSEHWHRPIGITKLPDLPFLDEESLKEKLTLDSVMITFKPAKAAK